ncbi:hypothetical protein GGR53DRAFT_525545 [Hypoxylon sp. FL1150]|nr:hypothetical protein GGR53DRAFT_525545 [Hypoxylon sp. FL1150]
MANNGGFGMFSLSATLDAPANDIGVDNQGRALRQRRYHVKSRLGCMNCKSRKVKCDEKRPTCRKCFTRGLECSYDQSAERQLTPYRDNQHQAPDTTTSQGNQTHARTSGGLSRVRELGPPTLDLEALQLMYHFEHHTSGTLLFGQPLWREQIIPLALQHDYLMHAVLTIGASHLHYLQPQVPQHTRAASVHLDRALAGFRLNMGASNLSQHHFDVIIACGFLLLHYAWSTPFFNVPNDASPSIESDGLLWFAAGLKTVILSAYDKEPRRGIFHELLKADHFRQFYAWSKEDDCSYNFEENFLRQSPSDDSETPENYCLQGCGNTNAGERLAPIFRAVDAVRRGRDISHVMPSILAYSLMWPSKAMRAFQDEVRDKNPGAMATMLSFYASISMVFSDNVWWAKNRSKFMCEAIVGLLAKEGTGQWERNVSKITEYFGFSKTRDGNWCVEE